jgi:aspartate aminotransferase/aminotransferase
MDEIGLRYMEGSATFYFFVSIAPSTLGSEEFGLRLLSEHKVVAVPGVGYGRSCDGYLRVGIGTESMDRMKAALRAVKALIEATSPAGAQAAPALPAAQAALPGIRGLAVVAPHLPGAAPAEEGCAAD